MNASFLRSLFLILGLCVQHGPLASAQGFAGLGVKAEGFAQPRRDQPFVFPRDHGPHPDFRIEWWYVTANLKSSDGTDYGVQWTLFRTALAPGEGAGFASPQLWMGHAALTTPKQHFAAERLARGGIGQAGVTAEPFSAFIDDWRMDGKAKAGKDALSALSLKASGAGFSYALDLRADGPIVPQGEKGYSVKSAKGQASSYYSQPFYKVAGEIMVKEKTLAVTGTAWLDREWSSQPLAEDQTGWDWFSLHFDSGEKLMGFRLRDGGAGYASATWIAADGTPTPLPPQSLKLTPLRKTSVADREIPVAWRIELPKRALDIETAPVNAGAWMDVSVPYWEGPIRFAGTHAGRGYLEMTGYE